MSPILADLAAGLVAGAAAVTVVLAARVIFDVPTLPQQAQDRILQALPGEVFAFMLRNLLYLGKPALFVSLLALQVVIAGGFGALAMRWRRPIEVAAALWLVTGFVLLPLLGRGVFDQRVDVALTNLVAYATYAMVLIVLQRARDGSSTAEAGTVPWYSPAGISRREIIGGGLFLATAAFLTRTAIGELPQRPGINPDGLPEPITPSGTFYIVSKNISDPDVEARDWRLRVDGLVNSPLNLSYADVLALPSEDFVRTMECISNEVGGDLISTGRFTGVRLSDVLQRAGVKPEARALHFTSADDYTETMSLQQAMHPDTFLVHKLNGQPITPQHGFPVRVLGAGTYGMKNPKWLTRIQAAVSPPEGFWEQQGWTNEAIVHTMSRLDSPRRVVAPGPVTVQGIAFSGDRGIQSVELSHDDGKTWSTAQLLPALGPLTWVFWQQAQTLSPGTYNLVVRATDGTAQAQIKTDASPFPAGATGYHRLRLTVSGPDTRTQ